MAIKVVRGKDEDVSSLLRRFKREVSKDDIIWEFKRREFFVNSAMKKKNKQEHNRKFTKRNKRKK